MNRYGQSAIEYVVFFAVFLSALILMSVYIKRGIQGNWHSNISTMSTDIYDNSKSNKTVEKQRMRIRSYDYGLSIREGSSSYSRKSASWISDGRGWRIWSK